tara:strand:+ start:13368 stop:13568 length:201 start_codon:yes stop_codon:yes gene_type:complete
MGKNRHAYTNANGNLVYYSNKEGMIRGKSGKGLKLPKGEVIPFTEIEQRQIEERRNNENRKKVGDA